MKWYNITKIILSVHLLSFILACGAGSKQEDKILHLPYYGEATFTPQWLTPDDPILDTFHRISPFTLTNQSGQPVTRETFSGKVYITDFFFTSCPGICPKMTANMSVLQEEFMEEEEVLLLSHSVTPERDSVPVLKAYADNKGIDGAKWHLVTGKQEDIYKLGRRDYFVEEDLGMQRELDEFLHTENFVLVDKRGHIRGIYNGLNKTSIQNLIDDVRLLLRYG